MSSIVQVSSAAGCDREILTLEEWRQIRRALGLSVRELEITQHIFDDNKAEYMATVLGISVHTVNTYIQRLYSKLDVRSRSQLVLRVLKTHLDSIAETCKSGTLASTTQQDRSPDVVSMSDGSNQDL